MYSYTRCFLEHGVVKECNRAEGLNSSCLSFNSLSALGSFSNIRNPCDCYAVLLRCGGKRALQTLL